MTRLALVAVPWAQYDTPSAALGALGAYMRREASDVRTDCLFAYIDLWNRIEALAPALYPQIADNRLLGDLIYASELFPSAERTAFVEAQFVAWHQGPARFADVLAAVRAHLDALATQLASYDVVGITTNASLFACLALAKKVKARSPQTKIVLGGAILSYDIEPTLQREFPFIDFVVQNDGERRLLAVVRAVEAGAAPTIDGVLTLASGAEAGGQLASGAEAGGHAGQRRETALDVENLDDLPTPVYDEYEALADLHSIGWSVPMEGSRGCWWCRVYRTGNTLHTCFFCSDIVADYREKSVARVTREIGELADRYRNIRIRFTDSILRHKDVEGLARGIQAHEKDFRIFMEVRASTSVRDLLHLAEAGVYLVQFGIEGLSSSYLKRIGKGTTAIQNLQAMRTCFELGMTSASNLLLQFPGATAEEVAETAHNIAHYAIAYEPTALTRFRLERGSAVFWSPERFGVSNIRPHATIRAVLPLEVAQNLQYSYLDYDAEAPVDWGPVERAWQAWKALHSELRAADSQEPPFPLFYYDGKSFLEIVDRRAGYRTLTLDAVWRAIYLDAMEIRSIAGLAEAHGRDVVAHVVRSLVREKLMFEEDGKVLSLAVAYRREVAVARIRAAKGGHLPQRRLLTIVR